MSFIFRASLLPRAMSSQAPVPIGGIAELIDLRPAGSHRHRQVAKAESQVLSVSKLHNHHETHNDKTFTVRFDTLS